MGQSVGPSTGGTERISCAHPVLTRMADRIGSVPDFRASLYAAAAQGEPGGRFAVGKHRYLGG
jgi:hypothetical protein